MSLCNNNESKKLTDKYYSSSSIPSNTPLKNTLPIEAFIQPSSNIITNNNNNFAIADSGSTDTLVRSSQTDFLHDVKPEGGLLITLPNGQVIKTTKSGYLPSSSVLPTPIKAHVVDDQSLENSLLSLSDYCNRGCTVTLTSTGILIIHPDGTVLHHSKHPHDKLWTVPLPVHSPSGTRQNMLRILFMVLPMS